MKFSFVIPAYNEESYLKKCLASVKKQGIKDYEVIVAYSPSSDNTLKIARKFGAKIVTTPKRGPGKAKNAGATKAKGEYIIFLDADTILPKNFLPTTIKKLNSGVIGVGYIFRSAENHRLLDIFYNTIGRLFLTWTGWFFTCYTVKRSAFLKVNGFDRTLEMNEDIDLARRLKRVGRIKINKDITLRTSVRRWNQIGTFRAAFLYTYSTLVYLTGGNLKYSHVSDIKKSNP